MATKKVLLFIVEGPTDEDTLSPVLKKIFHRDTVRFHVTHGDITTDYGTSSSNAITKVNDHIKKEVERYGYNRSDILQIIHLIDTDGAFVPDNRVTEDEDVCLRYEEEQIVTHNVPNIISRNARKKAVLNRLYTAGKISRTPYSVYYFSRNIEHTLHNVSESLTDEEKINYADQFADTYDKDSSAFIDLLSNSDFTVKGNYIETWKFIFQGTHSLHRHCNLHLLFTE